MAEKNIIPKYDLPKFFEFCAKYKFPDYKSKQTSHMVICYYLYAYYQFLAHTDNYLEFFKKKDPSHDEIMFYLRVSWSCAFAMYVHLRTAIDAVRFMRQMLSDKLPIDPYYEKEIKRICDIANDIVKHPTYKFQSNSEASEPLALEMNGGIEVITMDEVGNLNNRTSLNPSHDFDLVHNYIEYISERF